MGEWVMSQSTVEWVGLLDTTAIKVALGLIFFMYALDRPLRLIMRIKEFGTFPFNKSSGVTSNMMCALNGSIFLVLMLAIFETVINGSELIAHMFQTNAPLVVAAAYTPLVTVSGVMALLLILAVYWNMVIRYKGQGDAKLSLGERYGGVSSALKDRGASNLEIFSLPALTLLTTVMPFIAPYFA